MPIDPYSASSSGSGEANTSSNLGAGEGLASAKVGVDLPFKSIVAGSGISLSSDSDEVTVTAIGGIGSDEQVSISANDTTVGFLGGKLVAGANVTLTELNDGGSETLSVAADLSQLEGKHITGLISGGLLTINPGDNTELLLADGTGEVVDQFSDPLNPVVTQVSWSSVPPIPKLAGLLTHVAIDSTGTVQTQATPFTSDQSRDLIICCRGVSTDGVVFSAIGGTRIYTNGEGYLAQDQSRAIGAITDGATFFANGANLNLDRGAGTEFGEGINSANSIKDPNFAAISADTAITFIYAYQDGVGGVTAVPAQTLIDPDQYDDGSGTLASVPNNQFTNQRIFFFPESGNTFIQYGQTIYGSLAAAQAAAITEIWITPAALALDRARSLVSVQQGTTQLNDPSDAGFVNFGKFGAGAGAGGGATAIQDLQSVYDNSIDPEITTDSTRGAVTVKGGETDADNVFEGRNLAGANTFEVTAGGNIVLAGTVDGRDIATDGSKLDTITSIGSGDIITGAERTKLGGIETGAQVNTFNSFEAGAGLEKSGGGTTIVDGDTLIVKDLGITAAKMSSGAATVGQVATADGAGNVTYADAGGGSLALIQTQEITSPVATIDFTTGIDSTYSAYKFVLSGIQTQAAEPLIRMRVSTDGGSTFKSASNTYSKCQLATRSNAGTTEYSFGDSALTSVDVNITGAAGSNYSVSAEVMLYAPSETDIYKNMKSSFISSDASSSSGTVQMGTVGGIYIGDTDAVDAFRFFLAIGTNFTDGTISLYGVAK